MRVNKESPVQEKNSYLYNWDTASRKYFSHYEIHKNSAKQGLQTLFQSFFTRFRDPIQYRHRFEQIDHITYRQLLGDISKEEVQELNRVFSGVYKFSKSHKEPGLIVGYNWVNFAALTVGGWGVALYAKFVRGYNILWFIAPFVPFWTYALYNYARQPQQEIENCYKYLLAKRAATCEMEKNQRKFDGNAKFKSTEFQQLQKYLKDNDMSLYQLEADLVNRISSGQLK